MLNEIKEENESSEFFSIEYVEPYYRKYLWIY